MTPLEMIAEWRRGCSNTIGAEPEQCEECTRALIEAIAAKLGESAIHPSPKFKLGDHVRKIKGSQWKGRVVGTYSTELTPEGYAVESDTEKGSVQIYPAAALGLV